MKLTNSLSIGRTNTGGWALSRHYPHLLCWSWSLWFVLNHRNYLGRRFWTFTRTPPGNNAGQIALAFFWIFSLSLNWQHYDYPRRRYNEEDSKA